MGQCLRGRLADAGFFPKAPAEAPAETEASATVPVAPAEPETETELTAPALDVTPPAEVPENLVAASFGLLRAEPDGSVVIAGSGRPGSEVQVYSDETLLGSTTVESSGDWVFVPDQPLPPGGVEITLAERGKEGRAAQSFVVVVNEDKSTQPLVVASAPGQASEVLQGLSRSATSTPTSQVAASAPADADPAPVVVADAPAPTPTAPVEVPADAPAMSPAAPAQAEAAQTEVAQAPIATPAPPPAPLPSAPAEAATSPATSATSSPTTTPAVEAPLEPASAVEQATPEPAAQTAAAATPEATTPAPAADTPADPVVAVEPAAAPATRPADVPPTIDAIEIEGDRTFFAGGGPEGGIVRLYVDDAFIADATIEGGRWLVEAGNVLGAPSQRVRADLLAAGSPEVIARAEVDFVVDVPVEEPATAIASTDATSPATPASPAGTASPTTPVAAAPAEPAAAAPAAQSTQPTEETPPPAENPAPTGTPALEGPATPDPTVVAETPAASQPATGPAVPTMVAIAFGSPDAQRFASGKAIIRRGDNLWTIARRVYGEGIKYTAIYDANTGQIRDPDRIYPGQVFTLPQ